MQLLYFIFVKFHTADPCYHSFSQHENITFKTSGTEADFGHDGFPCCCFSPLMCCEARGSPVIRLWSAEERGRAARQAGLHSETTYVSGISADLLGCKRPLKGSDRKPAPGRGQEYRCHQLEWMEREPERAGERWAGASLIQHKSRTFSVEQTFSDCQTASADTDRPQGPETWAWDRKGGVGWMEESYLS